MDTINVVINMQATGERIKQLRKENRIKVNDLAESLGLESEQAIYKWQRGQSLPSIGKLLGLGIIFGCRVDDIIVYSSNEGEGESPLFYMHTEWTRFAFLFH